MVLSVVAIRYGIVASHKLGIVDQPGGHKAHDTVTPFVGGVGVLAATLCAVGIVAHFFPQFSVRVPAFLFGVLAMFITGFADDVLQLGYKIRFMVQAAVGLVMVFWGGVSIVDLGDLGMGVVQLGPFGVVLTVIATIGAINSLNMIDGIDGLSGSLSTVCLLLIAFVLFQARDFAYFTMVITIMGGVVGFLYFNLRFFKQRRARCFLGDNGSMQLGFIFAWLLADLSQALPAQRFVSPVTTLWLFAVPLIDTLSVMLRRLWMKRSPFRPDRNHLHHLFLRAGFRVQDTVAVLALAQLVFGAIGLAGLYADVAELDMLIGFVCAFALCFYVLLRPWRFVPLLRRIHRVFGFTSAHAVGVHVSGLAIDKTNEFVNMLNNRIGPHYDFRFSVFRPEGGATRGYGVIELLCDEQDVSHREIRDVMAVIRRQYRRDRRLKMRPFVERCESNDRRVGSKARSSDRRLEDRRGAGKGRLVFSVLSSAGESSVLQTSQV
ncbi:MAG: undecaprenyl/decaprenyl-phosphate alpha-N-acetylglucosaminyl 1-phosphate transferase [Zoogloea sp.]|nr:undecaprenyl/decaprenyl-phosphate alpha-N-acetylglucosaminyl 1-phosphate transferase [Zoogloea sp.]